MCEKNPEIHIHLLGIFNKEEAITNTLPKPQRTQGVEYFDSFNAFSPKPEASTSFEILVNQTSARFCLTKAKKYIEQL